MRRGTAGGRDFGGGERRLGLQRPQTARRSVRLRCAARLAAGSPGIPRGRQAGGQGGGRRRTRRRSVPRTIDSKAMSDMGELGGSGGSAYAVRSRVKRTRLTFFAVQASRLLEMQAGRLHHKGQIRQLIVTL